VRISKFTKKIKRLLAHITRVKNSRFYLLASVAFSFLLISSSLYKDLFYPQKVGGEVLGSRISNLETSASKKIQKAQITIVIPPTLTPTPTKIPKPTPTLQPTSTPTPIETTPTRFPTITPSTDASQYTAQQINNNTWSVANVQNDSQMATPQELFSSLNSYRQQHGVGTLQWDQGLADFAQNRAQTFSSNGELDGHAGFEDFMNNDGFSKIGFNGLGENSAYLSGPMNGDRIIKEIFGADPDHDGNQLDPSWQYVGVGISGNAVNVNFGKNKR
jgi:uncharacterized protein YkwD